MTEQAQIQDTPEAAQEAPDQSSGGGVSILDIAVLALCAIGVVAALVVVFDYSGITLFDSHAAEVIADAWNRNSTIGLIIVIVVSILVGVFVWLLAKSTLGSDRAPESTPTEH
jgi:flagellar basal body-associated protein FliL